MSSWFNSGGTLKKSQYYVWFLGSKESGGLRGTEYVLPVMHQLLRDAQNTFPNKVTVQVSGKGVKLVQTIPTISKNGKLKMEVMKFVVPAHSLAFSVIGPAPWTDVVCCILLVFNPETKCPVHVHCYRCDSAETAQLMNASLQSLICRRDNQRRLDEMEHRLRLNGLLPPFAPPSPPNLPRHRHSIVSQQHFKTISPSNSSSRIGDEDYIGLSSDEDDAQQFYHQDSDDDRVSRLHQALFHELKERLRSKVPVMSATQMQMSNCGVATVRSKHSNEGRISSGSWFRRREPEPRIVHRSPPTHHLVSHRLTGGEDGAMTSSTSGFGSDLSSSGGRFRFSIAEIPSASDHHLEISSHNHRQHLMDERPMPRRRNSQSCLYSSADEHHHISRLPVRAHAKHQNHEPQPPPYRNLRQNADIRDNRQMSNNTNAHTNAPLRMFGDTFKPQKRHNLVHPDNLSPPPLPERRSNHLSHNWVTAADRRYRSVDNLHIAVANDMERLNEGHGHGSAWNLPGMFDPFGKKYEQRPKVDSFWKNRAKRSSWYIPSNSYPPI